MPWWGLVFASALAFISTLPVSIITATTNQISFQKAVPGHVPATVFSLMPQLFGIWSHTSLAITQGIPKAVMDSLLGATGMMPTATTLNYNAWIAVGTIFNFFIFVIGRNGGRDTTMFCLQHLIWGCFIGCDALLFTWPGKQRYQLVVGNCWHVFLFNWLDLNITFDFFALEVNLNSGWFSPKINASFLPMLYLLFPGLRT
ncbi:hypothetical protein RJT34_04247 [Clitoria ternatea]|uniref:Uncharacterized protein n=1 Tax=Clitoria ternatea TaxID=43366 RepID=A0AAN9KKK4_CLITE